MVAIKFNDQILNPYSLSFCSLWGNKPIPLSWNCLHLVSETNCCQIFFLPPSLPLSFVFLGSFSSSPISKCSTFLQLSAWTLIFLGGTFSLDDLILSCGFKGHLYSNDICVGKTQFSSHVASIVSTNYHTHNISDIRCMGYFFFPHWVILQPQLGVLHFNSILQHLPGDSFRPQKFKGSVLHDGPLPSSKCH